MSQERSQKNGPSLKKIDFKNVVVNKPWGYEYLVFQNDHVAVWYLYLREGAATSLHCHPKKKTGIILLKGEAMISFLQDSHRLRPLSKLMIRPGLFHSTRAVSPGGIALLELETPVDKENLVRFEDLYGREGKSYEGLDQMSPMPSDAVRFSVPEEGASHEYSLHGLTLAVEKISDLSALWKRDPEEVAAVLDGALMSKGNEIIVGPGDVGSLASLLRVAAMFPPPEGLTFLSIKAQDETRNAAAKAGEAAARVRKPASIRGRGPDLGLIPGLPWRFSVERTLSIFQQTCRNRYFEFEAAKFYNTGVMKMPIYLSVGQEHIPASIASVSKDFLIFAQHRGHSYYLSFGGDPAKLADELLHRDSGCAGGMGGSASIHDPAIGMFGHSGLMGDQVPIAVGAALGSGKRVLTMTGDASVEEDYVFGAMGYAATKKLPVLFICEDNNLSILTEVQTRRSWNMAEVARSLGLAAADITDDPWLIAYYTEQYLHNLPAFLNIRTCRHLWHAGTGKDGEPEWNRFELFKQELEELKLGKEARRIEEQARQDMEELWQARLQRP